MSDTYGEATMKRPILDQIRAKGQREYVTGLKARGVTKVDLLAAIDALSRELILGYRYEVEACAKGDYALDQLHGVKGDCRKAEEVADGLIRKLEAERMAHQETKKRAARVLHGAAAIFTDADPNLADVPRGGMVNSANRGPLFGERGPEAVTARPLPKSDFDWST